MQGGEWLGITRISLLAVRVSAHPVVNLLRLPWAFFKDHGERRNMFLSMLNAARLALISLVLKLAVC